MQNVPLFEERKIVALYVDGGLVGKNPSDFGGSYAWALVDDKDELVKFGSGFVKTEDSPTTNNHTEMWAAIVGMEQLPDGWSGTLYSDSKITLGRLFRGERTKNLPTDYIVKFKQNLARLGNVKGCHLDGHPSKVHLETGTGKRGNPVSKWNKFVDQLCQDEVNKVKGKIK